MDRFDPFVKLEDINNPNAIDLDNDPLNRFDPFNEFSEVYKEALDWEKDPMNKPWNQNKYFFSDGKTYYEQICKMLRLMSVFKQAFNQIYDNEDEIHEAWENFVDNLSATAVYGEEVGVNLTWTDTSVNFAFTIPGGEDGVGIQSITFNSDYTMTITLTDGSTYTSESLRGAQGEQGIQGLQGPAGPQGEPGSGLEILDVYATLQDLQTAHPTGSPGDAYQVGTAPSFTLYIWSASQSAWVPAGTIGSAVPSSALPLMDGTASAGISDLYARGDHVHPTDTSRASAQDLQTVDDKVDAVDDRVDDISDIINTSQKLIDQSFVYRESTAEHDGLAVLDTIKGNTVKFNQLVQNGNFADTSNWNTEPNVNFTVASNIGTFISTTASNGIYQVFSFTTHKYYVRAKGKVSENNTRINFVFYRSAIGTVYHTFSTTGWEDIKGIVTPTEASTSYLYIYLTNKTGVTTDLQNIQIFDLTSMGKENYTVEQFEQWLNTFYSLSYYDYNPGTLLSFNGTGLKTVGFNQWDEEWEVGALTNSGELDSTNWRRTTSFIRVFPNTEYYISDPCKNGRYAYYDADKNCLVSDSNGFTTNLITVPNNCYYLRITIASSYGTTYNHDICINISDTSKNGTYEPYTSNTLSLPISTYFPTGMKDIPNTDVYDELTNSKAITRIGSRAYQSGDESDTSVITDGTTTYYALATPASQDISIDLTYPIWNNGTEQILPVNSSTPTTSSLLADMTYFSINDAMDYILGKLDQVPSSITSDINSLKTRMTSAEGDITSLGGRMTTAEGNITSLSGRMTTAEGNISSNASRISTLETDLLKVVVKEFDYDSVASESSVGTTTTITVDEGYKALGVVGTEIQAGEFTSPLFNSGMTQCHIEYTANNNIRITIGARNNSAVTVTNVRLYAYILCMKEIQSE